MPPPLAHHDKARVDCLCRQWAAIEAEARQARIVQREEAETLRSPTRAALEAAYTSIQPLPTHPSVAATVDAAKWDRWACLWVTWVTRLRGIKGSTTAQPGGHHLTGAVIALVPLSRPPQVWQRFAMLLGRRI